MSDASSSAVVKPSPTASDGAGVSSTLVESIPEVKPESLAEPAISAEKGFPSGLTPKIPTPAISTKSAVVELPEMTEKEKKLLEKDEKERVKLQKKKDAAAAKAKAKANAKSVKSVIAKPKAKSKSVKSTKQGVSFAASPKAESASSMLPESSALTPARTRSASAMALSDDDLMAEIKRRKTMHVQQTTQRELIQNNTDAEMVDETGKTSSSSCPSSDFYFVLISFFIILCFNFF